MTRRTKTAHGHDHFAQLSEDRKRSFTDTARQLVQGSIIEDAATRFMAQCLAYAICEAKKDQEKKIAALSIVLEDVYLFLASVMLAQECDNFADQAQNLRAAIRKALATQEDGK